MARESSAAADCHGIGLCGHCAYARRVESARGSVFYLCKRSENDRKFAKYPRLPVIQCSGYAPAG